MAKTKKEKVPVITDTTSITLNVPSPLYFKIKTKADKKTFLEKEKKTIHDQMIDDLATANK
jgi:hypothetical protein